MARLNIGGYGLLVTVLLGTVLIVGIGVSGATTREASPECALLARSVAGRTHAMLDGARFRATERQAYAICVSDPAAFHRIVRGY